MTQDVAKPPFYDSVPWTTQEDEEFARLETLQPAFQKAVAPPGLLQQVAAKVYAGATYLAQVIRFG